MEGTSKTMTSRGKHAATPSDQRTARRAARHAAQSEGIAASVRATLSQQRTSGRRAATPPQRGRRAAAPVNDGLLTSLRKAGSVSFAACAITMLAATPATSSDTLDQQPAVLEMERVSSVQKIDPPAAATMVTAGDKSAPLDLGRAQLTSKPAPKPEPKPTPEPARSTTQSVSATDSSAPSNPVVQDVWVRPIKGYPMTSGFGHRDAIPAAGTSAGLHNGVDFGAPFGTSILAASGGTVVHTGFSDFDTHTGGIIVIHHVTPHGEYLSSYNHMETSGILVNVGDEVAAGDVIGKVASTGMSTGPHLHFTMRKVTGSNPLTDWELLEPEAFFAQRGVTL